MSDRIANPWGERTPFEKDGEWPVRVDQFLEEGVSEDEVERWVQTASILHSNGDALDIAVKDGRVVGVRGRAWLRAADYQPPHEAPGDEYPFSFTTGRTVYHWHTRTKTGRAPQLNEAAPDAWVEINPHDAEPVGVGEGDVVRVESPRGRIEAKARVSGIKEGVVFAPFHYGYFDTPGGDAPNGHARAANELTLTEWDPVSKQPLFKVAAVKVTKVADADGEPSPAPTTTASAPVDNGFRGPVPPATVGHGRAEAEEAVGGPGDRPMGGE